MSDSYLYNGRPVSWLVLPGAHQDVGYGMPWEVKTFDRDALPLTGFDYGGITVFRQWHRYDALGGLRALKQGEPRWLGEHIGIVEWQPVLRTIPRRLVTWARRRWRDRRLEGQG